MVKYLEINKCGEECPHYDLDPQIEIPKFWGEHVCIYWWNKNEEDPTPYHGPTMSPDSGPKFRPYLDLKFVFSGYW